VLLWTVITHINVNSLSESGRGLFRRVTKNILTLDKGPNKVIRLRWHIRKLVADTSLQTLCSENIENFQNFKDFFLQ
jgi:hypothetical protein